MKSLNNPYPGMNPYLERHWGDVHATLIVYMSDQLNERLPTDLVARIKADTSGDDPHRTNKDPDIHVNFVHFPSATGERVESVPGGRNPEHVRNNRSTLRHIEIIDRKSGDRVVTTIELLSFAHKIGEDERRAFREKQVNNFSAGVNLIEIDLLRGDKRVLTVDHNSVLSRCPTPYLICMRRLTRPIEAGLCQIRLQQVLPNIPIPLRPPDRDVVLELQPLLNDCYRKGRYSSINYLEPLDPPLAPDDAAWSDELLRSQGLKP